MTKKYNNTLTAEQQTLVMDNMEFAMNLGRRFAAYGMIKGLEMEDLQQEACYGMCVAALHYKSPSNSDEAKGADEKASFQSYAYNWCVKYIKAAISDAFNHLTESETDWDGVEEDTSDEAQSSLLETTLSRLTDEERKIVCMVYGIEYDKRRLGYGPMGFKEIANRLNCSAIRVHRIYTEALKKLATK